MSQVFELDAREDIRHGRPPFARIMGLANQIKPGDAMALFAPFEPVPLYPILSRKGFTHQASRTPEGDWKVLFERKAAVESPAPEPIHASEPASIPVAPCLNVTDVDARGLEPPNPMIVILEAVEQLADHCTLRARTDRRPMHLYPQLEARGLQFSTEEQSDGSHLTTIRRH